ncbi:MAG TPA: TAXI family TRAP transporter solute-binding subunit [Mycobacterium sp.]|nr:TAXI family TRAP transporter solute-binding subunit [Mycobacterium sp.]
MTTKTDLAVDADGEIRLDRVIELAFRGDWGQANLTRICGWLAQEVGDRVSAGSRFAIWSGRGGPDAAVALAAHEADVAAMTPAASVPLVRSGAMPADANPQPFLRALGRLPHRDRLVIAIDADLPVYSVAELTSVADQLVIATCADDGVNTIGFAAHTALRLAGSDPAELVAAGAQFDYDERPFPGLQHFTAGTANVLIQEAIMTPGWQRIAERRPVRYLDWGDEVFTGFAAHGWLDATVPAGYLPGLQHDLRALDFADFVLVCRDDLDDELAYLITWCMIRTRQALEAQYTMLPPDRSPLVLPIDPVEMAKTPIPLHPAAERAYRDVGSSISAASAMWG